MILVLMFGQVAAGCFMVYTGAEQYNRDNESWWIPMGCGVLLVLLGMLTPGWGR